MLSVNELGIIGFGHFGQFAAAHLKMHFVVTVFDERNVLAAAEKIGVQTGPLSDVAAKPFVLFAVPVQHLKACLNEAAPFVQKGALVVDVSSVKVRPCQWMADVLPKTVDIVGTHPVFGPQSGKAGIRGMPITLCPVRGTREKALAAFLEKKLGLVVSVQSPNEHDAFMAKTQALAHFVGNALLDLDLPDGAGAPKTYQHLLALSELIAQDSPELFDTIEKENPFAGPVRKRLLDVLNKLDSLL